MDEFITVCKTADLPDGQRTVVMIHHRWVAVFNVGDRYYAIADLCTHDEGELADGMLYDYEIECTRHGARFDIRDGKVKRGPALSAVPFYATRIEGDEVQVSAKPIKVAK
jgi:3-phenylpropionate/trans-cinnamate dioxygenase ferredoxin component